MKRSGNSPLIVETLESRTLLSAVLTALPDFTPPVTTAAATSSTAPATVAPVATGAGEILHLTAGTSFTGVVAFYPSPVLDPPDTYSANINWGDGTTSAGKLQYGTQGNLSGYEIIGTHTYADPGDFHITTTVLESPLVTPGQPTPEWIRVVARISSLAIVSPANSTGGVTIHEPTGVNFTTSVGTFITPAPGTGLLASISWGDGTTSQGTLEGVGATNLDEIIFEVLGTHSYSDPGVYSIKVVVYKPSITPTATSASSPVVIVATIDSTAIIGATATPVTSTTAAGF